MQKGAIIPPHKHKIEQMSIVLSGVVKINVEDETIVLEKNNVLVIPEDIIHYGEVLEDAEYIDFWPEFTELFRLKSR
jgi:quercetin dioxygenase-like cupin family protein